MNQTNLYDKPFQFVLQNQHTNTYRVFEEPVGFDKVNIVLQRDPVYYGFSYEFLEDQLKLQFDEAAGRSWLRDLYDLYGSDARALFIVSFEDVPGSGVWTQLVKANINFNDWELSDDFASVSIEKVSFENKFRTRFDATVFLNSGKTLDDEVITPLQATEYTLHSKQLIEQRKSDNQGTDEDFVKDHPILTPMVGPNDKDWTHYAYIETTGPTLDQIMDVGLGLDRDFPNGAGHDYQYWSYLPNIQNGLDWCLKWWLNSWGWANGHYTIVRPGHYSLKYRIDSSGNLDMQCNNGEVMFDAIKTALCVAVTNGTTIKKNLYFGFQYNGTKTVNEVHRKVIEWACECEGEVVLEGLVAGDVIHSFIVCAPRVSVPTGSGPITGQSVWYKQSQELLTLVYYDSIVESSKAFGYPLFDAFQKNIELVTGVPNALVSSFLSTQGARNAIFNGYNIRRILNKPTATNLKMFVESIHVLWNLGFLMRENSIVVEKMEYFFVDTLTMMLTTPFDYTEKTATSVLINEFEIGYEKFEEEGDQLMDEFNTVRSYLTPIVSYKKKLSKKVPFIGSGYAIENQRRLQFASDVKSGTYDDAIFIVALNLGNAVIPEINEPFQLIENVIGPNTLYNARLSPARMMQRWRAFINSIAGYKPENSLTKNTLAKNNGEFTTQLLESDPYLDNTMPPRVIKESMDLPVLLNERRFLPVEVVFKHKMSATDYLFLRDAMLGEATSGNYGYLWTRDNERRDVKVWPMEIKFNPIDEEVLVTGLKKP